MARRLQPHEKDLYAIVSTVNEVVDGRSNNVGQVTLVAGATTTTVYFPTVSLSSMITLTPRTLNAAAALSNTYVSTLLNGSFVLTHDNNTQTDRIFDFSAVGG
jgi:hypothetical protein